MQVEKCMVTVLPGFQGEYSRYAQSQGRVGFRENTPGMHSHMAGLNSGRILQVCIFIGQGWVQGEYSRYAQSQGRVVFKKNTPGMHIHRTGLNSRRICIIIGQGWIQGEYSRYAQSLDRVGLKKLNYCKLLYTAQTACSYSQCQCTLYTVLHTAAVYHMNNVYCIAYSCSLPCVHCTLYYIQLHCTLYYMQLPFTI